MSRSPSVGPSRPTWTGFGERPYVPMMDGYRPGTPQHTLTVRVEVPNDADPAAAVYDLAEAAFTATNHPSPAGLGGYAGQIFDGIRASGYRGHEGGHYSLSIGDTVSVAEVTLGCEPTGWKRITQHT